MRYRYRSSALAAALALCGASIAFPIPPAAAAVPVARPAAPPYLPCPIASVPKRPAHPPRPVPPSRLAVREAVGGPNLDTAGLVVPPAAPPLPTNVSATSWLVADLDSGAVLGTCGPHEQNPPASVQKLLLAATLLPVLDPAQVVEVTPADLAIEPGSSAVGLVVGGRYPVQTLWLGLFLESGNDAAETLARVGGGADGVAGTLAAENALARHLGALDTHAATPSGLDGPGQLTSAYDLALIARADFARADFRQYDSALTAEMPAQPRARAFQIQNENKLLTRYPGALGGKTGFTDLARHTYVGAAQRNGRRLVVTLLDAEALPAPGWKQGASLLDWGFSLPPDASVGRLVAPGELDPTLRPVPAASAGHSATTPSVRAMRVLGAPPGVVSAIIALVFVPLLLVIGLRRRAVRRRAERAARRARLTAPPPGVRSVDPRHAGAAPDAAPGDPGQAWPPGGRTTGMPTGGRPGAPRGATYRSGRPPR